MKESFLKVAYVSKPHGLKGELFLQPLNPQAQWPKKISTVKIGDKDFLVEKLKAHKTGFIIKINNCNNKEQADKLIFQGVCLKAEVFKKDPSFYLTELLGFFVIFEGEKDSGIVAYFESQTKGPDFLVAVFGEYQCSIPFIPEYIQKIDKKNKKIYFKLPEGFLDSFKEIARGGSKKTVIPGAGVFKG